MLYGWVGVERGDRPEGVSVSTCGFRNCPIQIDKYWHKAGPYGKPPLVLDHATGKLHYHGRRDGKIMTEQEFRDLESRKTTDESEKLWHPELYRKYGSEWGCLYCGKHGDRFYLHQHICNHNRNKQEDPYWIELKKRGMEEKPIGDPYQKRLF